MRVGRGLQARMALSYVTVTVVSVLALEFLAAATLFVSLFTGNQLLQRAEATARRYASEVSAQAASHTRLPDTVTRLGNTTTSPGAITLGLAGVTIPYIGHRSAANHVLAVALLIAPDHRVAATSYPDRYPRGMLLHALLPSAGPSTANALTGGTPRAKIVNTALGRMASAVVPVWGAGAKPIGALCVQIAVLPVVALSTLQVEWPLVENGLILLLLAAPIGALFGLLTTRSLVQRLRRLAATTTAFADGDLSRRVSVGRNDEIGQLEDHVNRMADRLGTSIGKQRALVVENARLAERAHLARELHDAITQDLFSLNMLAGGMQGALSEGSPLRAQAVAMEETVTHVLLEMRALLLDLRPADLNHQGLAAALDDLAMTYRTRLGLVVSVRSDPVAVAAPTEDVLWRIAQEAVSNAVRHPRADTIHLDLAEGAGRIELTIVDNGRGFTNETMGYGQGLRTMRERVTELGGTLTSESGVGRGTCLHVCIPYRGRVV